MKQLLALAYCIILSYAHTNAQITVYVVEPPAISRGYTFTWADPGGGWGTADLNNPLNSVQDTIMLVDDGTAADSLGCNALTNNLTGKIAVVYRGTCQFGTKALNAQNAGAVGVIIINNIAGPPVGMAPGTDGAMVTVPFVMLSDIDGAALRAEMNAGTDVIVFIGNKTGLFNNDLGMSRDQILTSGATANPILVSQNATEFNVPMGAWIHNYGINNQTNVTLTATISGADNYSATSTVLSSLLSGDSAYFTVTPYSAPSYSGLYHINYTINFSNVDDFTSDNSYYANFLVDSLISYTYIDTITQMPVSSAHYRPTAIPSVFENCIHFRDPNASRISASGLYTSASGGAGGTMVGEFLETRIYEWNDVFTGLSTAPTSPWTLNLVGSGSYTYAADLQREMVYIPFTSPVNLIDDQRYLICAVTYNATDVFMGFDAYYDYAEVLNNYDQPISIVIADANQYVTGFGTDITSSVTVRTAPSGSFLNASVSSIDACSGCDGQATATVSGGTAPFTYQWDDPSTQTNATATNLCVGSYNVFITDALGDTTSVNATIGSTTIFISTVTVATCDSLKGDATAFAFGGAPPYTYLWNDPLSQTTQTATGLSSGSTYIITITDAGGCSNSSSITIPTYYPVSVTVTGTSPSVCGGSDGTATAVAVDGATPYSYFWPPGFFTPSITGLIAGSYTVQVTDANGCTSSASVTISDPGAQILTMTGSDPSTCTSNDGTATATATGGTPTYTYLWDDSGSQTTLTATGLGGGIYNVTVTDASGCIAFGSSTLTAPGAPSVTTTGNDPSCGTSDGTATASASGGTGSYTYAWNDPGSQSTATATGLGGGTFTVTVTDGTGCTVSSSVILTSAPAPTVFITGSTNPSSCGASDGTASATGTGGTLPYGYAWSSGGTTANETGLGAGNYIVTVTDANGCSDTASVTLTDPGAPTISVVSSPANCTSADGSASAFPSGGTSPYFYAWNDPGTQSNAIATGLASGTYILTVTDNNGCTASASTVVGTTGTGPVLTPSSNPVSCFGGSNGSAAVAASGGVGTYTYAWSNGATVAIITGLVAGTYTVTVSDANGCESNSSTVVTEPTQIVTAYGVTEPDCDSSNGSTLLTNIGGTPPYSYQWDVSAGNQTSAIATGLAAGAYTVTVSDANGCSEIEAVNLSNAGAATVVTAGTDVVCFGGSNGSITTTISGGTPPFTYSWSNSAITQNLSGLPADTYTLTMEDSLKCIVVQSVVINEPVPILVQTTFLNVSTPSACDGSATATASNGVPAYAYQWDVAAASQTTSTAFNLCVGTYSVTVTDANNCSSIGSIFVDSIAMGIELRTQIVEVLVFPNPNRGAFEIVFTGIQEFDVEIRNLMGQVIYLKTNAEKDGLQQHINLENSAAGIYFLTIRSEKGMKSKRLVIE